MQKLIDKIKEIYLKISKNEYVRAFCFIYFLGLVCFSIRAISNHFTLPMGGDYTLQTYAFYSQGYHVFWNFIKTGQYPLFDFTNYLGANYLGTQSFYYVFSPLFYLLCLWPEKFLYQGIFFHMVFKFAVGGFFMYILLKKHFHVSQKMSTIGGFIYAFSGWALFYLWFHFGDVMAFFPVFIMGIEKCLKERKGWLLALGTFLCGMSNYFFLVNFCIFGVLYALYRWIYIYGINKKRGYSAKVRYGVLLQGILYCGIGILMAGICLLPSLHVATSTNRNQTSTTYIIELLRFFFEVPVKEKPIILGEAKTIKEIMSLENLKGLFRHLFVWSDRSFSNMDVTKNVDIGYILSNWIYMNTNCWDNIMFDNPSLDNSLGGFFITTPLTMLLIPSIVKTVKTKRPWAIFGVIMCLILPFLPITSHVAFAFTSLYGRWELWIVLIGIIFIIPTLDRFEEVDRRLVTLNLILNYTLAIIIYFISKENGKLPKGDTFNLFGYKIPGMLLLTGVELLVMLVVWVVYRFKLFKPAMVKRIMSIIVVAEIGTSVVVTVENKGYANWETYYIAQPQYEELQTLINDLKEEDPSFYRIMNTEATRSIMNLPSQLGYNGASCFNSTYDFDLDVFKNRSKMAYSGGWTMGNHEKRYWLDQYIGTKYYIIDKNDPNNDNPEYVASSIARYEKFDGKQYSVDEAKQDYRLNLPWNYQLYKEYEYYDVYINKDYIGIGYCLDNFIASETVGNNNYATYYEELYASTVIVEDDDVDYFKKQLSADNYLSYFSPSAKSISQSSNWDLYFSPREDMSRHFTGNYERQEYKIEGSSFKKEEIAKYLPGNSQFFHERWIDRNFFGDKLIYKLKDGRTPLAIDASEDNICYLTVTFKLGPKVLFSFYNGDTLVTQDAHMNSNSSLNDYSSEWKMQRGFYLNQPVDKIVIEFVDDTSYSKVFSKSNVVQSLSFSCTYQKNIEKLQSNINESLLTDVTYKNNKFTFKSHTDKKQIAVTNIPYDAGWKLKMNGNDRKILKVNGGFVGFITSDKEATYELSYVTPNLKLGLVATGVGLLLFIILAFVYKNTKIDILLCENQIADVYLNKQKMLEDEYFKNHEEFVKNVKQKIKKMIKR